MRKLGALEGEVMRCLWADNDARSVRQVLERLDRQKPLAYTTVMTVLENLLRKGLVRRTKVGRAFRYEPTITRDQYTAELLGGVLAGSGDRDAALLHFVEHLSTQEQAALRSALQRLIPQEPGASR